MSDRQLCWAEAQLDEIFSRMEHVVPQIFSIWKILIFHVGSEDEATLKEVCNNLLGPLRATTEACKQSNWEPSILGYKKHDLLKAILQDIARQRKHQRLVPIFNEHLKTLEQEKDTPEQEEDYISLGFWIDDVSVSDCAARLYMCMSVWWTGRYRAWHCFKRIDAARQPLAHALF